jgi:manganese/zinc/iron transport system substrate-binding protein
MKTLFASLFLVMLLFVFGCSQNSSNGTNTRLKEWMSENQKIKVLSSIQMIGDLVQQVGGDRVDALVLIGGELDPHTYELVKGDDEKLKRSDLIFYNGLGLEHGAGLSHYLQTTAKATAVGESVFLRFPDRALRVSGTVDPHIWMDVSLWAHTVDPILDGLCKLDPQGAGYYQKNAAALKDKLFKTHQRISDLLKEIDPSKRRLVTSHDAFNYFARAYLAEKAEEWQTHFKAPEGLAPEGQLSPLDIKKIIDYLQKYQVGVVFPESNVSKDSLKKIIHSAQKMGLKVEIANDVLYGDAGCAVSEGEVCYLKMMEHNAKTIHRYLGDKSEKSN